MQVVTVGISDCQLSTSADTAIVTHSLGSCIAVVVHDPVAQVGGMLHFLLPSSTLDPAKAKAQPFAFADTGIPELFHRAYGLGAEKKRMRVAVLGGARVTDTAGVFNIGKKNQLACHKILWGAGVTIQGEETGGELSRTVRLEVGSGAITWSNAVGQTQELDKRKGQTNYGVPDIDRR
jgi:chemotaxis protein CheD